VYVWRAINKFGLKMKLKRIIATVYHWHFCFLDFFPIQYFR
jgi:hypothetical protein